MILYKTVVQFRHCLKSDSEHLRSTPKSSSNAQGSICRKMIDRSNVCGEDQKWKL